MEVGLVVETAGLENVGVVEEEQALAVAGLAVGLGAHVGQEAAEEMQQHEETNISTKPAESAPNWGIKRRFIILSSI
jgi:hypothetical protein